MLDSSTGQEIVFQRDVDELADLMGDHRRHSAERVLENIERKENVETSESYNMILFTTIPFAILAWICTRLYTVRATFAEEFEWFDSERGYRRAPLPQGDTNFSMHCVGTAILYPNLYTYLTLGFSCQSIDVVPATFLMIMVREFKEELRAIHWAGSAAQLNHSRLEYFLGSYTKWTHPDNHFYFLFRSMEAFETSFAVLEARERLSGSVLNSLFRGGLCSMAITHFKEEDDALEMARSLLGRTVVYYKDCSAAAKMAGLQSGMEAGSNAAGAASATVGVSVAVTASANAGGIMAGTLMAKVMVPLAKAAAMCPGLGPFAPICLIAVLIAIAAVVGAIVGTMVANDFENDCQGEKFYTLTRNAETGKLEVSNWSGYKDHVSKGT